MSRAEVRYHRLILVSVKEIMKGHTIEHSTSHDWHSGERRKGDGSVIEVDERVSKAEIPSDRSLRCLPRTGTVNIASFANIMPKHPVTDIHAFEERHAIESSELGWQM